MQPETSTKRSAASNRVFAAALVVAVIVVAAFAWFLLGPEGDDLIGNLANAPVLETFIDEPISGAAIASLWSAPSAVVSDGDRVYILDTGNNRILSTDGLGVVDAVICETDDCAFTLASPEDMDIHQGLLYVANTGKGTVEVIDSSGSVVRTMEFPAEGAAARTTGIYVTDDGSAYVSDTASGHVGIFGPDGEFQSFFGESEGPGALSFSQPAGLTVDGSGNLYVAEFTVGRVQKVSPIGRHLIMFEMLPGATTISEATDVVIDDNGFLYMADIKRSLIHVFAESGDYRGIVGLLDGTRIDSPHALRDPYGLDIQGDRLTVIDRVQGQLNFKIIPEFFEEDRAS